MSEGNLQNIVVGPELERLLDGVSLGELLLVLLKKSWKQCIADAETNEELTSSLLLKRAIKLAKWFKNQGVGVGDCISVNSENRLEFCIIPVATLFVGATFAPLNPDYTPRELNHVLNLSKPKFIFCSTRTIDKMVGILPEHSFIRNIILFGKKKPKNNKVVAYESLIKGKRPPVDPKETVATILCSSGTTGLPKGVMCTHDNMTTFIDVARATVKNIVESDDPNDSIMGLVPFFHSFGFMLMFLNILRGKKMIVLNKFRPKLFLDALVNNKVIRLIVPPPILIFLIKHPLVKQYDLSFIKEVRSGAAAIGRDMERALKDRFKIGLVSQAYGMTETTLGVLMAPDGQTKIGSCGKIVPGMMVKIIDEEGKALGPYKEGEICFKGPLIMKGYVGDPKSTHSTIDKDGWLHTGDVAYYDDEGFFFIVDRIKELIKYKAFQVAPAELEALLLTHSAIQDAAVIGLPDEDAGELPLAYIVKKPEKNVTEQEVEKFVADNVSPQKQLRGGVIFVNEIPRNPTGKILRRILKQQAVKKKSKL
ncbi:hypothetical protein NQ314_000962 [Rhamnusium bicolor]|uniref:Uncharacterized protein n=1 Tax=Rhamnusium bicolor TaxID=1586634 RepID=A0AAV8ZV90_9CUCU|nr:hypothetical protein NQ314_000962 [Rhamnusium bicolor]